MVTKIPISSLTIDDQLLIELEGYERSVLLSILTSYGSTLFFVDDDGNIVQTDELDSVINELASKLAGDNMWEYPRSATLWRGSAMTIPDSTVTEVPFTSYTQQGDFYDIDNPERVKIELTGRYIITAACRWSVNGDGQRLLGIRDDDNEFLGSSQYVPIGAASQTVSACSWLEAGQYLRMIVFHSGTGGSLSLVSDAQRSPYLGIARIQ